MGTQMRPERDPYGNPVPPQPWRGMTLDDLLAYAETGRPVSTVPEGKTGYGLDEVGNAAVEHDTAKPFDWKRLAGGALAGLGSTPPGANFGQGVGRGFLGATDYLNEQETQGRRNALTESQIQYQQGRNDLNQLEILDYPTDRAREADRAARQQELDEERARELRARVADILSGTAAREKRLPFQIEADKALAAQRLRPRSSGTGGLDPNSKDYRLELRTRIATLLRMKADAERAYDHDTADDLQAQINDLLVEQERVMRSLTGALSERPFPVLTAPGIEAAPPGARGPQAETADTVDSLDPQPGETAQAYADRVGPRIGKGARVRWNRMHGTATP